MTKPIQTRDYFVDEAGCLTLFDKRGRIILGKEGVSKVFLVGVAQIQHIDSVTRILDELRQDLLSDPYFKDVPSMQVAQKKTTIQFHAKDDLPEVRREVFRLLPELGAKVQVIIRRKWDLAKHAQERFKNTGQKITANEVYDDLVKRLFKNLLHKDPSQIVFARRGKEARSEALRFAIERARNNFEKQWNITSDHPISIDSGNPSDHAGLQIIDYYLWSLQRLFEKGEDRFFSLLANDFRLIIDLDDHRTKQFGTYYSDSNSLEIQKIKPVVG